MDSALETAAQALSVFDPLAALKIVALREDPDALAMRGVAMAQLGDYGASRKLLERAAKAFRPNDSRAGARCLAARGEVSLACRDLADAGRAFDAALRELDAQGDRLNAAFVRVQRVRRLVLMGAVGEAAAMLRAIDLEDTPPRLRATADLVGADIAMRNLDPDGARQALVRARRAARFAAIASLSDEIERAAVDLEVPVARAVREGVEQHVDLDGVTAILRSNDLVVDACRRTIRVGSDVVSLVTRPVLMALAITLASACPHDASRASLVAAAFGGRRVTDSMRARLRVEIGRLRRSIADLADLMPTEQGYALQSRSRAGVVVLLPPAPGETSALLALLRGGESWTTSALATAMGTSQRTVQRALIALHDEGRVEAIGRGRAQRWVARPPEGFATTLLLVVRGARD